MEPHKASVAPDMMQARVQYEVPGLEEDDLAPSPLEQFSDWFAAAVAAGIPEPNAVSLATCGPDGPQVRVLLAKEVAADGLRFFTNLTSAKAQELQRDPRASALFAWIPMHRQIRFSGTTEPLPREECAEYFATRPRGAQIGAWASRQSQVIASRDELRTRAAEFETRFGDRGQIPLPDHWGGYLLRPDSVEFWQGQPSRLHDRLRFRAASPGAALDDPHGWSLQRLAP
jgi:pyridoxamine 5'-phosphate oxidase